MRSRRLEIALTVFAKEAAMRMQADLSGGAELSFDLTSSSSRGHGPRLYCYQPQTDVFIRERWSVLRRLPSHGTAVTLLESFDGLERYMLSRDVPAGRGERRRRTGVQGPGATRADGGLADGALHAFIEDVFAEQSEFEVCEDRLQGALERLDRSARSSPSEITLLASLHGLAISSEELTLAQGLTLMQPSALRGAPQEALAPALEDAGDEPGRLLVAFTTEETDVLGALGRGRAVLGELLRALRLFGDGRIALGRLAWARVGEGGWSPRALPWGGRPHGMLVVSAAQEDELRAFCSLVARRAPREGELAWALARFEMGCERTTEHEALSDYLLALRALLEPEARAATSDGGGHGIRQIGRTHGGELELRAQELGPAAGEGALLAERLAVLCALAPERPALIGRVEDALDLERAVIEGQAVENARTEALVRELAGHLRALLRDVICGHLDADLTGLAEELLECEGSGEEAIGDDGQTGEIANVLI